MAGNSHFTAKTPNINSITKMFMFVYLLNTFNPMEMESLGSRKLSPNFESSLTFS